MIASLATIASAACGFAPDAGLGEAGLTDLTISRGTLSPAFDPDVFDYTVGLPLDAVDVTLTATAEAGATLAINQAPAASGQESTPISLDLGVTDIILDVSGENGDEVSYRLSIDRGADALERAYVKASNTDSGDSFGGDIALDGDTLAVSAPIEDSSAPGVNGDQNDNGEGAAGAVYVFVRSGDSWLQQAYIKASNPGFDDTFGGTIALSGDLLAVAARSESSSATGIGGDQANDDSPKSGAVYVFIRSGTEWSQEAYIKASNADSLDLFGVSLDLDGTTLVVGADGEDSSVVGGEASNDSSSAGAAYVFERGGNGWSQTALLKASNASSGDAFGIAVAIDGDTIAVGAQGEDSMAVGVGGNQDDNSLSGAGAVYVFARQADTWVQEAYIKASNTGERDLFGRRLAISGSRLVVGVPQESSDVSDPADDSLPLAGAAYVFARDDDGLWSQEAFLKASNANADDEFADAVAIDGDIIAIGTLREAGAGVGLDGDETDNSAEGAGALYIFTRKSGSWSQRAYVKASNAEAGDGFGASVAVSGFEIAVGAVAEASSARGVNGDPNDNTAVKAGSAYVID